MTRMSTCGWNCRDSTSEADSARVACHARGPQRAKWMSAWGAGQSSPCRRPEVSVQYSLPVRKNTPPCAAFNALLNIPTISVIGSSRIRSTSETAMFHRCQRASKSFPAHLPNVFYRKSGQNIKVIYSPSRQIIWCAQLSS
jgi:hypothetical protein